MSVLKYFVASPDAVARMRRDVLFERDDNAQRYSKFWVLMVLSSALATAGILTESLPALIGAMIISPFITPMTGVMLSIVLSQRGNIARSVALVLAGASAAVALGFLLGLLTGAPVTPETNSLVADRVAPDFFDLVVGLLTGVVAAIALVREDISNSVPGVAIAVTLVPALAVAGLMLESGAYPQAWGAIMLFGANAVATLATGTATMLICGVRRTQGLARVRDAEPVDDDDLGAYEDPRTGEGRQWSKVVALVAMALVIAAPLAASAIHLQAEQSTHDAVRESARDWAEDNGVEFVGIDPSGDRLTVSFEGPTPLPEPAGLAAALTRAGVDTAEIEARLLPVTTYQLDDEAAADSDQ